jgi:hypothetical protein
MALFVVSRASSLEIGKVSRTNVVCKNKDDDNNIRDAVLEMFQPAHGLFFLNCPDIGVFWPFLAILRVLKLAVRCGKSLMKSGMIFCIILELGILEKGPNDGLAFCRTTIVKLVLSCQMACDL